MDPISYATTNSTWGLPLSSIITFATIGTGTTVQLSNGADDTPSTSNLQTSYDLFANPDEVDISLIITGDANTTLQGYVRDIAESRKDCIAFISPPSSNVVNQAGNETTKLRTWASSITTSTYVVADCGWKYMFDKYNNVYRWIPLNGDIAGLCVNTDSVRDPWFSPAGFNRGALKNVVKLAWNPTKAQRDTIYPLGINPVGTFPGQGTVLFGDKTFTTKPSAFDRINVRRLFIVLEKTIAQASKYSLFEFNDEFTRSQFVALVTPFLRDVQGRRGIYDFRVVCDTTNNTPQVIDSNQFVGDIYVKPARSINFIQLNFVAVRTGVNFSEIVGQF
jgi:phage tail sheath protein FI